MTSVPVQSNHRLSQLALIASTLLGSWLGMQAVHEAGHVLGAWLTGGRVACVILHPLNISRTDLAVNPHPLAVVWAGPVIGIAIPLALWVIACITRFTAAFLFRFFAGFCWLANGLYIGLGSLDQVGDCGDMLRHGSSISQLWLFGELTAPVGLWLWHGQGTYFGLGGANGVVDRRAMWVSITACAGLLILGLVIGGW